VQDRRVDPFVSILIASFPGDAREERFLPGLRRGQQGRARRQARPQTRWGHDRYQSGSVFWIREGRTEKRTLDRLRAAEETGQINGERREALEEAFRLLADEARAPGCAGSSRGRARRLPIDPKTLGPITRLGLKVAFKIIAGEQKWARRGPRRPF
jgi:Putative nucleotidyltransferase substrate binding domain